MFDFGLKQQPLRQGENFQFALGSVTLPLVLLVVLLLGGSSRTYFQVGCFQVELSFLRVETVCKIEESQVKFISGKLNGRLDDQFDSLAHVLGHTNLSTLINQLPHSFATSLLVEEL